MDKTINILLNGEYINVEMDELIKAYQQKMQRKEANKKISKNIMKKIKKNLKKKDSIIIRK